MMNPIVMVLNCERELRELAKARDAAGGIETELGRKYDDKHQAIDFQRSMTQHQLTAAEDIILEVAKANWFPPKEDPTAPGETQRHSTRVNPCNVIRGSFDPV